MTENCFTRASVARQRIIDLVEMITCSIPAHPFNGYAQWLRAMVTRNGYPHSSRLLSLYKDSRDFRLTLLIHFGYEQRPSAI